MGGESGRIRAAGGPRATWPCAFARLPSRRRPNTVVSAEYAVVKGGMIAIGPRKELGGSWLLPWRDTSKQGPKTLHAFRWEGPAARRPAAGLATLFYTDNNCHFVPSTIRWFKASTQEELLVLVLKQTKTTWPAARERRTRGGKRNLRRLGVPQRDRRGVLQMPPLVHRYANLKILSFNETD